MNLKIIILLFVSFFIANEVFSCCAGETRCLTEMLITRKSPIYYAKVISSVNNDGKYSAQLEIIESFFDSNNSDTISINTGNKYSSTGGTMLKKGSVWLIYDGFSICSSFTKPADSSRKFLSELNLLREFEDIILNKKSKNIEHKEGGVYLVANFKKGVPNGYFEHYYPNRKIKTKSKYKNGVKNGNWTHYYKTGEIKSTINYERGQRNGQYFSYNQSGKILGKSTFLNDSLILSTRYKYVTKYYLNGKIKEEYTIKNGNSVDGKWNKYYENGNLKSTQLYSDNKLIETKKYHQIDGEK